MTEVTTTTDFDEAQKIGNPVVQAVAKAVYGYLVAGETSDISSTPLTRADFVKLIVPALGLPLATGDSSFADVTSDNPLAPYIAAAKKAGIVNGVTSASFGLNAPLSRAELISMYVRAYEYVHGPISGYSSELSYKDSGNVAAWAQQSLLKAQHLGVAKGYSDGTVRPSQQATRAESLKMIERLWFPNN
jgi:beta-lactamase class A